MMGTVPIVNRFNLNGYSPRIQNEKIYTPSILNLFKLSKKVQALAMECFEGERTLENLREEERHTHSVNYAKVEQKGTPVIKKTRDFREVACLFDLKIESERNRLLRLIESEAALLKELEEETALQNKLCVEAQKEITDDFFKFGKETSYCLSRKHLIKMAEIIMDDAADRINSIASKMKIHQAQLELISHRKEIKLLGKEEYESLPERMSVNIKKVSQENCILRFSIEPSKILCRYELIGQIELDKSVYVLELCAIPGDSIQNCSDLEFIIDRDLLYAYEFTFPINVVALQTNGEYKKICTII